jgi:drug/metabolite transporter (DMT)-like permease
MMIEASRKRPKRLWVAAIINILVALLSLALLAFLFTSARVPEALLPGATASAVAACTAGFLIVASVLALLGKPYGRYLMLAAAIVFYGILIVQNVGAIAGAQAGLGQSAAAKLAANTVRASLELLINLWALLSLKTRQYFGGAAVAP